MKNSRGRKHYRVLMFGWEFPPYISGGLGTACHGLCSHICKLGTEVLFVMPKVREEHLRFKNFHLVSAGRVPVATTSAPVVPDELIKCLDVDSPITPYMREADYAQLVKERQRDRQMRDSTSAPAPLRFSGDYGASLLEEVHRLARVASELVEKEDFDIVHAHDWMTYPAAIEAARKSGKPLVCHVHATEFDRGGINPSSHIAEIERFGLERADVVLAVSERTKKMIVRNYDVDSRKIKVIHNAVERAEFDGRNVLPGHSPARAEKWTDKKLLTDKIVLYLGRVTSQKGPDYFVDAAKLVLNEMDDVRFVMAGDGDLLPRMIERVAAEGLHERFHFSGFLTGDDVSRLYSMSDVFVMPSVSEPFGITPFEAMVYRVPIIVSKQSGITEVLENAIKVDFWNVRGLADGIVKVLSDKHYAKKMGDLAAAELEEVSWELSAVKVLRAYRELLKK